MEGERRRQEDHIELIASENYTSPRVLQAQGSVLTNKFAEGYPGKRYYGGCEYVDMWNSCDRPRQAALRRRLCQRAAAFRIAGQRGGVSRALDSGDPIMGMSLAHGGHLTHGASVNVSVEYLRPCSTG